MTNIVNHRPAPAGLESLPYSSAYVSWDKLAAALKGLLTATDKQLPAIDAIWIEQASDARLRLMATNRFIGIECVLTRHLVNETDIPANFCAISIPAEFARQLLKTMPKTSGQVEIRSYLRPGSDPTGYVEIRCESLGVTLGACGQDAEFPRTLVDLINKCQDLNEFGDTRHLSGDDKDKLAAAKLDESGLGRPVRFNAAYLSAIGKIPIDKDTRDAAWQIFMPPRGLERRPILMTRAEDPQICWRVMVMPMFKAS